MTNYTEELFKPQDGEEQLLSHYRVCKDGYGREIKVPVVDVRDGVTYRILAYQMTRGRQSKYINYNQYHTSRKK